MNPSLPFTNVPLGVALIVREGKLLTSWNEKWGTFSLPMSKPRVWMNPNGFRADDSESLKSAAIRAAAEVIARPLAMAEWPGDAEAIELQPFSHRSLRDGKWKRYDRHVFVIRLISAPHETFSRPYVWLDPAQTREFAPISPTVGEVVDALAAIDFQW